MALMNNINPRSPADRQISFNILFKDVFGCALLCVILVGAVHSLLRKDFEFTGQLAALVVGALLGAVGAVLLERTSARD
jgi:uncharacterized membrane protein